MFYKSIIDLHSPYLIICGIPKKIEMKKLFDWLLISNINPDILESSTKMSERFHSRKFEVISANTTHI